MSEGEAPQDAAPDYEGELARMRLRVADAELRAAGAKAGIQDLDALKMLSEEDRHGVAEEAGAAKAVAKLRKDKPWLFTASTSAAARAPAATAVSPANAMAMTHEEWRAARSALLRKQGSSR
jgi:hypothetical protein